MKFRILAFLFMFVSASVAVGQKTTVTGKVFSGTDALPFVTVFLPEINNSTLTDAEGNFTLTAVPEGSYTLKINVVGFKDFSQQIEVKAADNPPLLIDLSQYDMELNTVVVTGTMRETMISNSPVKIEVLNRNFFNNNPVNSVIEALETVNGVQEQINCGVCGTNDIHINGMEGPYTLVLIDGMPIVSGLSSVYGFNGIPTSLIERVEIIKGPSSTLYGTEAVGGVINIITKTPEKSQLINTEIRYNTHDEFKAELSIAPKLSKTVFMSLSGDFYYNNYRMDFNGDGFTDIPLNKRLSIFNKWQINNKAGQKSFSLALRYLNEDRFGGELNWTPENRGSETVYGESILTERFEAIGSYIIPTQKRNLRLDFSANQHEQDSYYGNTNYGALQQVFFSNLILENKIGKRHFLTTGLTNNYLVYTDNTPSNTDENNYIPGIFAQNEFSWTDELTVLAGARLDHHQRHGFIFSPRLSIKKTVREFTNIRLNYGTGFRQVFLFTEDHAFVSGARDVVIEENLNPERSHNVTLNLNHTYAVGGYGNFDVDLFYTYFSNKIIPDFDTDPNLIIYNNLGGYGITRGASVAINHKFTIPLRAKLGVTFMDVFEKNTNPDTGLEEREDQIFAPRFSGVFSIAYELKKWRLSFNYNGKVVGPQRLPTFADGFERPEYSNWFTLQHCQVTKTFKNQSLEVFTGIKNIFNYTQDSPLIDPQNPFGDSFDTAYAYGSLQVRRFYVGLRFGIDRKDKTNPQNK